jgi:hypothetical protein
MFVATCTKCSQLARFKTADAARHPRRQCPQCFRRAVEAAANPQPQETRPMPRPQCILCLAPVDHHPDQRAGEPLCEPCMDRLIDSAKLRPPPAAAAPEDEDPWGREWNPPRDDDDDEVLEPTHTEHGDPVAVHMNPED